MPGICTTLKFLYYFLFRFHFTRIHCLSSQEINLLTESEFRFTLPMFIKIFTLVFKGIQMSIVTDCMFPQFLVSIFAN